MTTTLTTALLRRKQVQAQTGLARSTLYKLIAQGNFPRPLKLTSKAVGWQQSAIDAWIQSRVAGQASI